MAAAAEEEEEDEDDDDDDEEDEEAAAGAVCSRRSETRGISTRGLLRQPRGAAAPRAAWFRHGSGQRQRRAFV
jgi:hypothetical protein